MWPEKNTWRKNADKAQRCLIDVRVKVPNLARKIQNVHIDVVYMKFTKIVMMTML